MVENQNSDCLWGKGLTERGHMVYAFVKTQVTVHLRSVMSVFVHYTHYKTQKERNLTLAVVWKMNWQRARLKKKNLPFDSDIFCYNSVRACSITWPVCWGRSTWVQDGDEGRDFQMATVPSPFPENEKNYTKFSMWNLLLLFRLHSDTWYLTPFRNTGLKWIKVDQFHQNTDSIRT